MGFPGENPRAVEVMAAAAASAAASPSSHHTPQTHRPTQLRVKPRSRLRQPPFTSWDNNRLLRCGVAGGGLPPTPAAAPTSTPSPSCPGRRSAGPRDDGFERIRAKLMDHLREAAGRIELPLGDDARRKALATDAQPTGGGDDANEEERGHNYTTDSELAAPAATTKPAPSATAGEELPWTLRARRTSAASSISPRHREHANASRLAAPLHRAGASERREAAARRRRPRFSVPLTNEEIDEDMYAFTGRRAPRRPKKRPRALQKQLDMMFPGMWLSEVTAETYHIAEPPPPPPPS